MQATGFVLVAWKCPRDLLRFRQRVLLRLILTIALRSFHRAAESFGRAVGSRRAGAVTGSGWSGADRLASSSKRQTHLQFRFDLLEPRCGRGGVLPGAFGDLLGRGGDRWR